MTQPIHVPETSLLLYYRGKVAAKPAFRSLRELQPGSIVLFGRCGRDREGSSFGLDTCFMVDRAENHLPVRDGYDWPSDLLTDAVLRPIESEGAREALTVYIGRTREHDEHTPFSFTPARLFSEADPPFSRPQLAPEGALAEIVNPKKNQGIKVTSKLTRGDRDAIWNEIARQVSAHGCTLGHRLAAPPVISDGAAREAARRSPKPITP